MRLIQWNCQGAFRTKNDTILSLKPDVLVVSECEKPEKLKFGSLTPTPGDYYWYGDNENKGIGVFSYSDFKLTLLDNFNPEFRYVLPFRLSRMEQDYTFFAIWAMNNKENRDARYIGQIWFALNYYRDLLNDSTILIGDFNSNKIWDYKDRVGSHSKVVNMLREFDIYSLYHEQYKQDQGKETRPTFYLYRKQEKPYHIDYCFASKKIIDQGFDLEVGDYHDWIGKSDHTPIRIELQKG
jgi:exodeoxyribonuclease III